MLMNESSGCRQAVFTMHPKYKLRLREFSLHKIKVVLRTSTQNQNSPPNFENLYNF